MKRFKRITGLLLLAMTLSPINVLASGFKDLENHWARDRINYAIEKGYASGYEDNTFKPKGKVTRAEFVSFLNNFFKTKETFTLSVSDSKYNDVEGWYKDDILMA